MDEKPEAVRLAEKMKSYSLRSGYAWHCHKAADELVRLHAIETAAKNLVKVKGRYHTEQAFNRLKELLK